MRSGPRRGPAVGAAAAGVAGAVALVALAAGASLVVGARSGLADHAVLLARVPRTATGLATGAALGTAGALLQGLTRNPLAEPGLLGLGAGAAAAVVAAVHLLGVAGVAGFLWFAFAGAAAAGLLVHVLAARGPAGATPVRLVLVGTAVTAVLSSAVSAVLVSSQQSFESYRSWQVGALTGRGFDLLVPVLPFLGLGAVLALACAPALDSLALGDDVARGLGRRVGLVRLAAGAAVVLLVGASVAVVGPLAFVGLLAPHAARRLVGSGHTRMLPVAALTGAVTVLVADVAGRVALPPGEVPAGVVVALLGGPLLVALVRRSRAVQA